MLSLIGVHDSDFVIKLSKSQIRTRMYVVKSEKKTLVLHTYMKLKQTWKKVFSASVGTSVLFSIYGRSSPGFEVIAKIC